MAKVDDLRFSSIDIPVDSIVIYYKVLTDVYTSSEEAKRIAKCNVHTFPDPSIDQLIVIFEREIPWASLLRDGINEVKSEEVNQLLDEYQLVIVKHVQWNETADGITIRSKMPVNMAAIANDFTT